MRQHCLFAAPLRLLTTSTLFLSVGLLANCGTEAEISLESQIVEGFAVQSGSREEVALIAFVNDPSVTLEVLDDAVGLDSRAARNIFTARNGPDGESNTSDDVPFATVDELDAISYVGTSALARLVSYALANGYAPGEEGTEENGTSAELEALAMLAFVNDAATSNELLDDDVGLDSRAARNIVTHRDGADATPGTGDDDLFDDIAELDAVSYVGKTALASLTAYAIAHGWLDEVREDGPSSVDVIFSPQAYSESHTARIKGLIEAAERTIDVAMYSMSDTSFIGALEAAVDRGVVVRMVYETANADRKKSGTSFENSRSAKLERAGVDVMYVNKIMHHKFIIVDGPKNDLAAAVTARIATGSANWSNSAATRYDENTLFFEGEPAVALLLQKQFEYMWTHARDFVGVPGLSLGAGTAVIDTEALEAAGVGDDDINAYMTSDNFSIAAGSTTFRRSDLSVVSDRLVAAIEGATESIWIASGHLRSRPVSEAVMAAWALRPDLDIRVLLDGQEYLSASTNGYQLRDLDECLAEANTATQVRNCNESGFLFSYELHSTGIPVRYSWSAYRWHYSYAQQMHHKLLIIDSDELWTGSYNLSANAEFKTFENIFVLRADRFQSLIDTYEADFLMLWERNRDGAYADVMDEMATATESIPLTFDAMTLTWDEVTALKSEIRATCPAVNTTEYRTEPESHRRCFLN